MRLERMGGGRDTSQDVLNALKYAGGFGSLGDSRLLVNGITYSLSQGYFNSDQKLYYSGRYSVILLAQYVYGTKSSGYGMHNAEISLYKRQDQENVFLKKRINLKHNYQSNQYWLTLPFGTFDLEAGQSLHYICTSSESDVTNTQAGGLWLLTKHS